MPRPRTPEITPRELEVMHVFWDAAREGADDLNAAEVRERLARRGRKLAYTTVATLVRILTEKGFIKQTHGERPYRFRPVRSFDDVSRRMVSDLVKRVFHGSRESLLLRLLDQRELSDRERTLLEDVLRESDAADAKS